MSSGASRWILVASVVLNVFLVGGLAGGTVQWFSSHGKREVAAARAPGRPLRFAAESLSPERQKQFFEALKSARREGRADAREARAGREDVLDIVAARQFDRAALDAALARTRAGDVALRTRVEQAVADFAATLSPDERARFAEGLRMNGQWRLPGTAKKPASGAEQTSQATAASAASDGD
ncbi:periplasmic heavy metal sensor [Paraburkholderia phosphatilytica]|uniref:periplasmic heavy metal sensor n=1 Tax=Paraburkholderia phosphatilytica TaxID=2282883 RepID=UPI000E4BDFBB|nr:periplasmic heavy metal sensor [Paraburkholderia phosphatilytica]